MFSIFRLILAASACLWLTNCQLINTAWRLAPLLLLVDDHGKAKTLEQRGKEVEARGLRAPQTIETDWRAGMAFSR